MSNILIRWKDGGISQMEIDVIVESIDLVNGTISFSVERQAHDVIVARRAILTKLSINATKRYENITEPILKAIKEIKDYAITQEDLDKIRIEKKIKEDKINEVVGTVQRDRKYLRGFSRRRT